MRTRPALAAALLLAAASTASTAPTARAQAPALDRARTAAVVDSVVAAAANGWRHAAGMSVAVLRGADTITLRGYGRADLELDVPTPDRAVYEIGSVTKQFTAAAILQLVEQGKLSLDDPVTRHLPAYPTQGRAVTVRRLLDHTSGIRGYTEMAEFGAIATRALPRDTLAALFASQPFDFEPGAAQAYNNSAYFLLGLVIERVSGRPYAEYVKANLFDRAGMPDSHYCSNTALVPRRAHGYDVGPRGLQRAQYMDHTWPYAAGSLCSTAADLAAWTRALHGGRILGPDAYREMLAPGRLNDGTALRYAKGLVVNDSTAGHAWIQHGGDIPGHSSFLAWVPAESLTVAVLVNTAGPLRPDAVAAGIVRALLGDRTPKPVAFRARAADYVGDYRGIGRGRPQTLTVAADSAGAGLVVRVNGAMAQPLTYLGGETFGRGASRYTFVRERKGGPVTALRFDSRTVYSIATRVVPAGTPATGAREE